MNKKLIWVNLLAIFTMAVLGSTFTFTKILLGKMGISELVIFRFIIAYIALFIIRPEISFKINLKNEMKYVLLGLSGVSIYYIFENIALRHTTASNVALIIALTPILTAIFSTFIVKDEKINRNIIIGFVFAMIGVVFILYNKKFILKLNLKGDILALISAIVWALYSIMLKKFSIGASYIKTAKKTFLYGILTSIPFVFILGGGVNIKNLAIFSAEVNKYRTGINISFDSSLLYLGVIASALCYVIWEYIIKNIGVIKASNFIYLNPVFAMITAYILLNESISIIMLCGTFFIFLGIFITQLKTKVKL